MANNSIGAYAQGGLNEIGAYERSSAVVVTAAIVAKIQMRSRDGAAKTTTSIGAQRLSLRSIIAAEQELPPVIVLRRHTGFIFGG